MQPRTSPVKYARSPWTDSPGERRWSRVRDGPRVLHGPGNLAAREDRRVLQGPALHRQRPPAYKR